MIAMRSVRMLTVVVVAIVLAGAAAATRGTMRQAARGGPRIEILFAKEARAEAVTGRVYVAISRDNQRPPIEQADPTGVPLFSKFVEPLAPTPGGIVRTMQALGRVLANGRS